MRAWWKGALVAAGLVAAGACGGGDGGNGPSAAEITGTWNLTKMLYVNVANQQQSIDLVAQGGTGDLVIDPNKSYTLTLTLPGQAPLIETGAWDLSGDIFSATPTGMPFSWDFDVTVTATTLRLAGADVEFDIDDDGTDEAARLTIEATR